MKSSTIKTYTTKSNKIFVAFATQKGHNAAIPLSAGSSRSYAHDARGNVAALLPAGGLLCVCAGRPPQGDGAESEDLPPSSF